MRWNRDARRKLAKIIWERSLEIDKELRSVSRGLDAYMSERNYRIPAYFENLGFSVAAADEWVFDPSSNFPPLFKPKRKHLFFAVNSNTILKVDRELAAKILVLGLP